MLSEGCCRLPSLSRVDFKPALFMNHRFVKATRHQFMLAVLSMGVVVLASNILVQYTINDWLTWGAITYPFAFLVSELVNRRFGPGEARHVAWFGFAVAVAASAVLAPARIAAASGMAFVCSQMLDIYVFDKLRHSRWWQAPLIATVLAACLDTAVFWSIGFAGEDLPWVSLALGDLGVKLVLGIFLLLPFRLLMGRSNSLRSF